MRQPMRLLATGRWDRIPLALQTKMPTQRIEAALEIGQRAHRAALGMHGHARNRARRTLTRFDHRSKGRVLAALALFTDALDLVASPPSADAVAQAAEALAAAGESFRRLDHRTVFAHDDGVPQAGLVLCIA